MATWTKLEDIEVWQDARDLCIKIWNLTETGSFRNDYKLRNQMLGSSGSIMDNIAEGFGRGGNKEFCQFLSFSVGSCFELSSQIHRSLDRKHIDKNSFDSINAEIIQLIKRLKALITYLKESPFKGNKFKEPAEQYLPPDTP